MNGNDIEWNCEGPCGDTLGRNSYVTMVTTSTGEVVKAEKGRVIDMEPQFPVETEYLCFTCYAAKYKDPLETLRVSLKVIANSIELMDDGEHRAAYEKLNELVVYIAGVLPSLSQKEGAIDG